MSDAPAPGRGARVAVAAILAILAAALVSTRGPEYVSDFDQLLAGGRALRAGGSPYAAVGPGRAFDWPWPLYYPLPAILFALPFSYLPLVAARATFFGISSALFAFAITRESWHRLPVFASAAMMTAAGVVQWSPLVTAAALLPWLGALLAAKPNLGAALWLSAPSRRASLGAALFLVVSLAVQPSWPAEWVVSLREAPHFRPPLLSWAGPPLLLALLRWRRPEARLLVALACVPQTGALYETVPLFLVPAGWVGSGLLALLTHAAQLAPPRLGPFATYDQYNAVAAQVKVALVFLPCLVMVLRRPNVGEVPAWLERLTTATRALVAGRALRSREVPRA
ncbi:MAG: hypothetical protein ACJ79S_07060 [Gemmatimonadaceae bacterium]